MADERDPKLSQHYRELEPLEPPAELDRRILAAAREPQGAHAPLVVPAGRHRWYYSLAAAAVLVFAVAITLHVEREKPDPEITATAPPPQTQERSGTIIQEPKPQAAPAESKRPEAAPPAEPAPAKPAAAQESQPSGPAVDLRRLEKPVAPAAPRPAAKADTKAEARPRAEARDAVQAQQAESQERARLESGAMARSAPAQGDVGAAAAARVATPPEKPERWLERIAELRSRGRHAEADRELAEFRRIYPNYSLSEVMRERVEGR